MSGNQLVVKGWSRWQSYRKDRGTPPWIKVHRNLMSNSEWATLTDAEKGQLVSIWILAADKDGMIASCPRILRKLCILDDEPNINKFKELGFLEDLLGTVCQPSDNQEVTGCPQHDAPETETETETDNYNVETNDIESSGETRPRIPFSKIVSFLNKTASTDFKATTAATKRHIKARWNEGFRLPDFEVVIESKYREWSREPEMVQYIRPATLFGTKFESYLQAAKDKTPAKRKSRWKE